MDAHPDANVKPVACLEAQCFIVVLDGNRQEIESPTKIYYASSVHTLTRQQTTPRTQNRVTDSRIRRRISLRRKSVEK